MNMNTYLTQCRKCGANTSKQYARQHDGQCKTCATGIERSHTPTRNERLLEHGYWAYAREEGHYE